MPSSKVLEAFLRQRSVTTDSRKVKPGDIFFALSGENFDGNQFAAKALEDGAALAVVSSASIVPPGDPRYVLVPDTLLALQDLARSYRRSFTVPVIGITGTNGKTTSKELIHAVLSTEKKVHATVGNLNNHIGVPLTLLQMPADTEIAIIEMGANKHGDIKELVEIAEPTHCMITNIGRAHLERFGDIDGVEQTKGEMFDYAASHDCLAFVNVHDARVKRRAAQVLRQVTYGIEGADYWISNLVSAADHLQMTVRFQKANRDFVFRSNLIGPHNAENVLLAVAIGDHFGVSVASIQKGLQDYFPRLNRTELIQGPEFKVFLDAYNANPSSMEATLRGVSSQDYGKLTLFLGDMFELGRDSHVMHVELVRLVKKLFPTECLVGVGKEMSAAIAEVGHGLAFSSLEDAAAHAKELTRGSKLVLIKGSRGMALERLLPHLGITRNADH